MQRGASMTTSEHIDPAIAPATLADMEDPDKADIPEGAVRFEVTAEQIADALAAESLEVCTHMLGHVLHACALCEVLYGPVYANPSGHNCISHALLLLCCAQLCTLSI